MPVGEYVSQPQATIEVAQSIASVPAAQWDALAGGHPLLSHAFLDTLHATGCAAEASGWAPHYLLARQGGRLVGAMPLYLKYHSWGEYVFDWAWADAWERAGQRYYPKLLSAIPFSPVSGPRLLVAHPRWREPLLDAALSLAADNDLSSFHCLFPSEPEAEQMAARGLLMRTGVQFHWENAGYESFDALLATMSHDKRKKIRQERRKVAESGVTLKRLSGAAISEADMRFFHRCYVATYRAHRSTPYLTSEFFQEVRRKIAAQLLLVIAERDGKPIASALNLFDASTIYGRYWGATEFVPGLHFETCYYQAIEFAIERGIAWLEGGAQGEHKLARGFRPVKTLSAHWLAHPEFARAVETYLKRETHAMASHIDELNERAPFRKGP